MTATSIPVQAANYTLTLGTATNGANISLADGTNVSTTRPAVIDYPSIEQLNAVATNLLSISPAVATSFVPTSYTLVNNIGGTAPVAASGTLTLAAVSDFPSTQAALQGVVQQLNKLRTDLQTVQTSYTGNESAIAFLRSKVKVWLGG